MVKKNQKVKIFSALEVANICGVVNQTAINWIKNGYLKAFTTPGGQYRIYARDLDAFLDTRGMNDSREALHTILDQPHQNTLLLAVEESICNYLRNELGALLPDFFFLEASDGFELGWRLTTERPSHVILDIEMQGVNLYKLFHYLKEDPLFGKPYVFTIGNPSLFLQSRESPEDSHAKAGTGAAGAGATNLVDQVFSRPLSVEDIFRTIKKLEK